MDYYYYYYYYKYYYLNGREPHQPGDAEVDKPNIPILVPSQIRDRECQAHAPQLDVCALQHQDLTSGAHLEHGSQWVAQVAQMIHNQKKNHYLAMAVPNYTCLAQRCIESQ